MKILIVNPFGIGDVLFVTPIVQILKKTYSDSKIGFLCNRRTKPILETNPYIDNIYVYEKDNFRKLWKGSKRKCLREFINLLRLIRKDKYNVVLDLSLGTEYSFFLMLIGIKTRIGYNYKNRGKFLTVKVNIDGYHKKHVVEYYLALLKYLGITPEVKDLKLFITDEDKKKGKSIVLNNKIDLNKLVISIIPGGGITWEKNAIYKQWPARYYVQLIDSLVKDYNAQILLLGAAADSHICNDIMRQVANKENVIDLSGKTDLRTLAYIVDKSKLVIGNDGGLLHIAVSQGVKTVSMFGPVNEEVYGPYPKSENHIVITKDIACRPCYHKFRVPKCRNDNRCINEIEPKEVMAVVSRMLDTNKH